MKLTHATYHILVVEDEYEMAQLIASYLTKEGYEVTLASDGTEMLDLVIEQNVDLIVLDIMMPGLDGFTACRRVREFSHVPIIMLTAKGTESDRVDGLKMGADDYMVKPFSPNELVARIEALLRRTNELSPVTTLHVGNILIDLNGRSVTKDNERIELTRKEFDLFLLMARNKGKAFSREQLHHLIWGMDHSSSSLRTVDTHIKTLRIKLGEASQCISTVWGVGYKVE